MKSVSQTLLAMIKRQGCKTLFGVPGAYSIHFVDSCTNADHRSTKEMEFILTSNEAGAAFMAQGYSQVTGSLGCAVTTAGPAALNTIAALASAKSDGDRVLLVHGEIPKAKRGQGLLQDTSAFGCRIEEALSPVVHDQFIIDSAADLEEGFERLSGALASPRRTTHLMVGADAFSSAVSIPDSVPFESENAPNAENHPESEEKLRQVEKLLIKSDSMILLVGHGIYQARGIEELHSFLDRTEIPTMVTGRAAACIDPKRPYYLGQHSIFSHERVNHVMKTHGGKKTDLLLVIGSSLGEFASNGGASYLKEIPNIVHVNVDERCFGRLGKHALNLNMDAKRFLQRMISSTALAKSQDGILEKNRKRREELLLSAPMGLHSRLNDDLTADRAELTGQRLVYSVSQVLNQSIDPHTKINVVADTGSSKLYAAHYFSYRPGSRCIMNSGSIDCLGYGLSAAIGAAVGSKDIGENALTICFVGDGGLLMNNELNTLAANASLRGLKLLVFILNDAVLSYVHQGFSAVMGRPLESTRFNHPVDFAKMASAFGLPSITIRSESEITPDFFTEVFRKDEFPLVVDCRISNKVIGPGLGRYNQVRSLLGKAPLLPEEMQAGLG